MAVYRIEKDLSDISPQSKALLKRFHEARGEVPIFKSNLCSPPANIFQIKWKNLLGLDHIQGGSSGVFSCTTGSSDSFIIKGADFVVQDYFATLLGRRLGFSIPRTRVIAYYEKEFKKMVFNLFRVCHHDKYLSTRISNDLDRPFLMIMEYIPSLHFINLGRKRSKLCFANDPSFGYTRLRQLGNFIALDVFLNNSDRLPVIWDTDGNPNNMIIQVKHTELSNENMLNPEFDVEFANLYAIDSTTFCIDPETSPMQFEAYRKKVARFTNDCFNDVHHTLAGGASQRRNITVIKAIQEFLQSYTGEVLDKQQLFQILKGVIYGFYQICQLEEHDLIDIFESIRQFPQQDKNNLWEFGTSSIIPQYFFEMKTCIQKVVERHTEDLNSVLETYEVNDPLKFLV